MIKFSLDEIMFKKNKMKVPELTEKSGVNKNTLYSIYNSTSTRIDLSVIDRLCRALGCTPGDLLKYVDDEEKEKSK